MSGWGWAAAVKQLHQHERLIVWGSCPHRARHVVAQAFVGWEGQGGWPLVS